MASPGRSARMPGGASPPRTARPAGMLMLTWLTWHRDRLGERSAGKKFFGGANNQCTTGEFGLPSPSGSPARPRGLYVEPAAEYASRADDTCRLDGAARSAPAAGHRHPDRDRGRRCGHGSAWPRTGADVVGGTGDRVRRQRRAPELPRNDLDRHRRPDHAAGGVRQVGDLLGAAACSSSTATAATSRR